MELEEVMKQKVFLVVGNTVTEGTYAYRIKSELGFNGCTVYEAGPGNMPEATDSIDIVDLCINPVKGLAFMKDMKPTCKAVVIQPGASSPELLSYLQEQGIPYLESCVLKGLSLYVTGFMQNGG